MKFKFPLAHPSCACWLIFLLASALLKITTLDCPFSREAKKMSTSSAIWIVEGPLDGPNLKLALAFSCTNVVVELNNNIHRVISQLGYGEANVMEL